MPENEPNQTPLPELLISVVDQLVAAYAAGEECGGSIEWSDLDAAHATALAAKELLDQGAGVTAKAEGKQFHVISGRVPDRENSVWAGWAESSAEAVENLEELLMYDDDLTREELDAVAGPEIEIHARSETEITLL